MQSHFLCCENEHEITSLANISDEEQAPQADPSPGSGGRDRGSEHPSGSLPAAPLPLALPLDLAVLLLAGQTAPLQELIGDPSWDPAG